MNFSGVGTADSKNALPEDEAEDEAEPALGLEALLNHQRNHVDLLLHTIYRDRHTTLTYQVAHNIRLVRTRDE